MNKGGERREEGKDEQINKSVTTSTKYVFYSKLLSLNKLYNI